MQVIRCTSLSPGLSTRFLKANIYIRPLQRSMSFSSSSPAAPPTPPRPSASLLIINERNEILLVRRNPKATAFGGMHVRVYSCLTNGFAKNHLTTREVKGFSRRKL